MVALGSGSPSRANGATGVPAGETTTTVTRRTLTESSTVDGTLGYKGSYELYDRLAEAGTFTWLPAVGDVIRRGGTLFRINNLPVVLMYGTVPAYRTLAKGVSNGPDVRQLNRNLKALGYDPYDEIRRTGPLQHGHRPGRQALAEGHGPRADRQGRTRPRGLRPGAPARHQGRRRARPGPARDDRRDRADRPDGDYPHDRSDHAREAERIQASRKRLQGNGQGLTGTWQEPSPGRGSKRPGSSCSPGKASKEPSKEGSTAPTSKPSGPKGNSRSGSKQPNGTNGAAPGSSEGSKNHAGDAKSPSGSKTPAAKSPGAGGEGGGGAGRSC